MAVRSTAYVHDNFPTPSGDITVDLYVLWPEGCEAGAWDAINAALRELAQQVERRRAG